LNELKSYIYLDEKLDNLDAILLTSDMKRGESVKSARINVRLVVEQEFSDLDVTTMGGDVKSGQKVASRLIDEFGRVIEENARRLDVIALRGHVKSREAVLRLGIDRCLTSD
jgi:hypothetical protein